MIDLNLNFQLPGVLPALRNISALTFEEDEYNLEARIRAIVDEWAKACPFVNEQLQLK